MLNLELVKKREDVQTFSISTTAKNHFNSLNCLPDTGAANTTKPTVSREIFYFWAFAEIHRTNCHTWWNNAIWHAPNTR